MKPLIPAVLLSAASTTIAHEQYVFKNIFNAPKQTVVDIWSKPLHTLSEAMKSMTSEAKAIWEEVSMFFPEEMDKVSFFSTPKPHVKKPDSVWDYILRGVDVQR
jgi:cathepsin A (carboxypeptidase C)